MCIVSVVGVFFFSSRRRHTRCALVTGVQTCALPILGGDQLIDASVCRIYTIGAASISRQENPRRLEMMLNTRLQIGNAACRERVCQFVEISAVAVACNKNNTRHISSTAQMSCMIMFAKHVYTDCRTD